MATDLRPELREAAMPLIQYMREHFHPHTYVVVTGEAVEVLETQVRILVPEYAPPPDPDPLEDMYVVVYNGREEPQLYNIFVKEARFFVKQKGLTEDWGRSWMPVRAPSIEEARAYGFQMAREGKLVSGWNYRMEQALLLLPLTSPE